MAKVEISLLGEPRIVVDGHAIEVQPRAWSVLAQLACSDSQASSTESLIRGLWGDSPPTTARKGIQVAIGSLRRELGAECIRSTSNGYAVDLDHVRIDVEEFRGNVRRARTSAACRDWERVRADAQSAMALWTGRALGWLGTTPWGELEAAALEREHVSLLELLANSALESDDVAQLEESLLQALALHPRRPKLWLASIRVSERMGRQAEAIRKCREALRVVEYDPADVAELHELERRLLSMGGNHAHPSRRHAAPIPSHRLIGRERELAVCSHLLSDRRILTIVGPGGTGKTRLANELARGNDSVVWIELASVSTASSVLPAIMDGFGVVAAGTDPTDAIVQSVGARPTIVVLDNFEHVASSAPEIQELATRCPTLTFLVTSRLPLGVADEHVELLAPLSQATSDGADATGPAVELFLERARAVDGLINDEAGRALVHIGEICRLVDGLPLGIELAAARTRLMTPAQIHDRLVTRFDVLRQRDARIPDRQRSLHNLVEWSYDLLDPQEQRVLRTLALFVGGCSLHDLVAIADELGENSARLVLDRLVAHSLVVHAIDVHGRDRWSLLFTIAAFARDRLEHDPAEGIESRFVDRMEAIAADSNRMHTRDWEPLERMVAEWPNVRSAIELAMRLDSSRAAKLFSHLLRFVDTGGQLTELEMVGESILQTDVPDPRVRGRARTVLGMLHRFGGRADLAGSVLDRALTDLEDPRDRCHAAIASMEAARFRRDDSDARKHASLSMQLASATEDPWFIGRALTEFIFCAYDLRWQEDVLEHVITARQALADSGDEFWLRQLESNLLSYAIIEFRDPQLIEQLDAHIDFMEHHGLWRFVNHLKVQMLRCLVDLDLVEAAAALADSLLDDAREFGDQNQLIFALASAGLAYEAVRRIDDAMQVALECLQLSVGTQWTLFVDYAMFVVMTSSVAKGHFELAAVSASGILPDELFLEFVVDQQIAERLREFEPLIEGQLPTAVSIESIRARMRQFNVLERAERVTAAAAGGDPGSGLLDACAAL